MPRLGRARLTRLGQSATFPRGLPRDAVAYGLLLRSFMKATDLLKQQHQEVARLFKAIESAEDPADKKAFFLELASNLVAHDGIEREIFYPACEEAMGITDDLGEALVEHGVVEFCLYQANEAIGKGDFDFKCKVLQEIVEHHVEEEEEEFLPKAAKLLGDSQLEALGDEMEEAFEEARAGDFQQPLYENLRQVFAGAIKPEPLESKPAPKKTGGASKARKSA
jgi:hemerythrin-like domain-containing protein